MSLQVYWPNDLLDTGCAGEGESSACIILGQRCLGNMFMVVNVVCGSYDGLENLIIGMHSINEDSKENDIGILGIIGKNTIRELDLKDVFLRFESINNTITAENVMIIIFDPPIPQMMQFYSLSPIPISLVDNKSYSSLDCKMAEILEKSIEDDDEEIEHTDYTKLLENLNNCWNQRQILIEKYPTMPQTWYSFSKIPALVSNLTNSLLFNFINCQKVKLKPIAMFMLCVILAIRDFFLIIIQILNGKIHNLPRLVEISATAQQIDLRLQQFAYFPIQYLKTTKLSLSDSDNPNRNLPRKQYPEYIRFYNTLWLIVNDITLGISLSALLFENEEKISKFFNDVIVSKILYTDLNSLLIWLMNSPGGIKLNNELAVFLSDLFRWIIEFWKMAIIDPFIPYYRHIVWLIAISSGTFGATLAISIFLDFLSIITLHIYCFYYSAAKIFNWLLNILLSLFYLFCGKKRNVLRKRIDSNDYELDQLLLGTLLFTVVVFLLPTVLAFYITFAITELSIMVILGTLEISTSMLNHFPIFVLLLRLKDPKRIPGGVQLTNFKNYIMLSSVPIGLDEMFDHFNNVLNKLKAMYLSKETAMSIIKGKPIHVERTRLYKLLYSALPTTPISTAHIWDEINNNLNIF